MELVVSDDGAATMAGGRFACALGRGGVVGDKREGDGATPAGVMRLVEVRYRPDRVGAPASALPVAPLRPALGWCDDPGHADYNRPVTLPHPARCERLWRDDGLYDIVVVTDHNRDPVVPGAGSAVFVHVAAAGLAPTEGCVAFSEGDLRRILRRWRPEDRLVVLERGPRGAPGAGRGGRAGALR